jgi:hypothetical protein
MMDPDPDEHVHPGQEDLVWGGNVKEKDLKNGERKLHNET